jgi:hypothetical protein
MLGAERSNARWKFTPFTEREEATAALGKIASRHGATAAMEAMLASVHSQILDTIWL